MISETVGLKSKNLNLVDIVVIGFVAFEPILVMLSETAKLPGRDSDGI